MAGRRKRVEMAERLSCGSALLSAIVNTLGKGRKGSDASEDGKTGEDAGRGDCVRERTVLYECEIGRAVQQECPDRNGISYAVFCLKKKR